LARNPDPTRRLGVALVLGAVVAWSIAGLFVRLVDLDAWTVLFWRGLFACPAVAALLLWTHGRGVWAALRGMGVAGCLVALCDVVVSVTYVAALGLTAVADVAVVYATVPLLTAALAWLALREPPRAGVVAAGLAAAAGLAVMVGGAAGERNLLGIALAVVMTGGMAAMTVLVRRHRGVPMVPAALASALVTTAIALPLASAEVPDGARLGLLALFGAVQMALGLVLFVLGSRLVPPGEAALLTCLEAPLAPVWVWLAFAELPDAATWAGGGVVLAAVAGHLLAESGLARAPRPDRRAAAPSEA
jgi:drug/metabolite transporter (DMT)-like permease